MGKLINELSLNSCNCNIVQYLIEHGFQYEEFVCSHNIGYQKGFPVDQYYFTYVHVDLKNKILNIYKEYDCGGEVASYKTDIPEYIIEEDDVEAFMEWLDGECEFYL